MVPLSHAEHATPDMVLASPQFLNDHEAATVDAIADRIIPGDADDPGAREARAVVYIDRTLAGADGDLGTSYRAGLAGLDQLACSRHGRRFIALDDDEKDALLTDVEAAADGPNAAQLGYFFAVVREHVLQGTFCDPAYGGNHDAVGWKLLGFPGAYWSYRRYHGRPNFDASELPIQTLADLRDERAQSRSDNG